MSEQPTKGELCICGRQAVIVYLTERFGPVGWCGRSDGGERTGPCPFCGESRREDGCPAYTIRLTT